MNTMVDLVFEIRGRRLPQQYHGGLWRALAACLPWLDAEPLAGLLEIRAAQSNGELLLPRRGRLGLRVPLARHDEALALSGREIEVEGESIAVGSARTRALSPQPTLGAPFVVTGARDDLEHQGEVARMLAQLDLPQRFICGRMGELRGLEGEPLRGASVVIHELRDEDSMKVQTLGIGPQRHLGCGVFVPRKLISGIE